MPLVRLTVPTDVDVGFGRIRFGQKRGERDWVGFGRVESAAHDVLVDACAPAAVSQRLARASRVRSGRPVPAGRRHSGVRRPGSVRPGISTDSPSPM